MTTVREAILEVEADLDSVRIAKERRKDIERKFGRIISGVGELATSVSDVPNPFVDDSWYGAKYYWANRDKGDARVVSPADVRVRPVRIEALSQEEIAQERTPSGWYPRVEIRVTVDNRKVVGDLTKDQAVELATELLAAAKQLS